MSFPVFFSFLRGIRGNSRFPPLFHSANFFFPTTAGLHQGWMRKNWRSWCVWPNPIRRATLRCHRFWGVLGACDFCGSTGVTRKTLHENVRKLGEAYFFSWEGRGYASLRWLETCCRDASTMFWFTLFWSVGQLWWYGNGWVMECYLKMSQELTRRV